MTGEAEGDPPSGGGPRRRASGAARRKEKRRRQQGRDEPGQRRERPTRGRDQDRSGDTGRSRARDRDRHSRRDRAGGGAAARRGTTDPRRLAVEVLTRIDADDAYANLALRHALDRSDMSERDRALATELVYGATRMRRACDALVEPFLRRGRSLDAATRAALRVGAYQLRFTEVPPHAAVSTAVGAAPNRSRGLVNAVLRRTADAMVSGRGSGTGSGRTSSPGGSGPGGGVSREVGRGGLAASDGRRRDREGEAEDVAGGGGEVVGPPETASAAEVPDLAIELSYPDWIVERLVADLGLDRALGALRAMNVGRTVTVRDDGYTQDRASRWVADLVGAEPGERVLDLCAAPGGKATAIAATGARVVAADVRPHRVGLVVANAERTGNADRVASVVADGQAPPFHSGSFDRVLVDAPCSGLGVLHRRADARWRVTPDDVDRLAALQLVLVEQAAALVRPGGVLVVSACTLTRAETLDVDDHLARTRADLVALDPPGEPWVPWGRGALLLPQAAGTDGMALHRYRVGA